VKCVVERRRPQIDSSIVTRFSGGLHDKLRPVDAGRNATGSTMTEYDAAWFRVSAVAPTYRTRRARSSAAVIISAKKPIESLRAARLISFAPSDLRAPAPPDAVEIIDEYTHRTEAVRFTSSSVLDNCWLSTEFGSIIAIPRNSTVVASADERLVQLGRSSCADPRDGFERYLIDFLDQIVTSPRLSGARPEWWECAAVSWAQSMDCGRRVGEEVERDVACARQQIPALQLRPGATRAPSRPTTVFARSRNPHRGQVGHMPPKRLRRPADRDRYGNSGSRRRVEPRRPVTHDRTPRNVTGPRDSGRGPSIEYDDERLWGLRRLCERLLSGCRTNGTLPVRLLGAQPAPWQVPRMRSRHEDRHYGLRVERESFCGERHVESAGLQNRVYATTYGIIRSVHEDLRW